MTTPHDEPRSTREQLKNALSCLREAFRIIEVYGQPVGDSTFAYTNRGQLDGYVDEPTALAALDAVIDLCEREIQQPEIPKVEADA